MPVLNISDELLDEYLESGSLYDWIVINVVSLNKCFKRTGNLPLLTEKERAVFDGVLRDLQQIEQILNNIAGKPVAQCPGMEQEQNTASGYTFKRLDYYGRHVVSIKRPGIDNFYWTIGENDQDGAITGYYSMGTNGNVADVREALQATKDFFPTPLRRSERLRRKRLRLG